MRGEGLELLVVMYCVTRIPRTPIHSFGGPLMSLPCRPLISIANGGFVPSHTSQGFVSKVLRRIGRVLEGEEEVGKEDKDADVILRAAAKCGYGGKRGRGLDDDALSAVYREAVLPLRKRAVRRGLSYFRQMSDKVQKVAVQRRCPQVWSSVPVRFVGPFPNVPSGPVQ